MTPGHLPTAKSRFLMDNLGYGLQTSKTATPKSEVDFFPRWQIPTKGGLFKNDAAVNTSVDRVVRANTIMYDFYSTNFAYQAPSYPSTYAYSNPEMNTSCSYRFPNYGFHTGHNGPRFPPCERVPNVARVESMRMVADNTPSKPDDYTRTLHHLPPTPPSNTHPIRGFNDEPLKKSCSVDKIIEELSDEGKMTHCVGRYKHNWFYMVYLIQTYLEFPVSVI